MGISGRQLRFRRELPHNPTGYCEIATPCCARLAMTSQGTLLHPEGRNDKPEKPPDGIPHRAVLSHILLSYFVSYFAE